MAPDFTGWATKNGLKCSDGRTIAPNAFEHQDMLEVPLVWQHGHDKIENVLGRVLLHNQPEGVRVEAYFNDTPAAQHAKQAVLHKDITQLSIWANDLLERAKTVLHGKIREVSLVLAGANPGALIDHGEGSFQGYVLAHAVLHDAGEDLVLDDEYIIFSTEEIELVHDDSSTTESEEVVSHAAGEGPTIEEVYNTMNDDQKELLSYLVTDALQTSQLAHSDATDDSTSTGGDGAAQHDSISTTTSGTPGATGETTTTQEGNENMADDGTQNEVRHNVFDQSNTNGTAKGKHVMSHDDMKALLVSAQTTGSLKEEIKGYALAHGVEALDILFPDAVNVNTAPEWISRQSEWAGEWLSNTRKTPMSRIKTHQADLTHEEARAKGYIKGDMKEEEYFPLLTRTTVPTTIYKKQTLDRDDWIDITDFDVAVWLKAEMRVMLNEEVARAGLIGDGRGISAAGKINEQNIRPIAKDNDLYATTVYVNMSGSAAFNKFVDAATRNRKYWKGTGLPNLYTTETYIAMALTLRDSLGRKIYKTLDELALELRVNKIIPVEAMDDDQTLIGIFVNPQDYVYGATRGGEVNLFDDFDIDFNKQKYLIETRCSGALVKVKSALVFRIGADEDTDIGATAPVFDTDDFQLHIPHVTGVTYLNESGVDVSDSVITLTAGQVVQVFAKPADGYYLTEGVHYWNYMRPSA